MFYLPVTRAWLRQVVLALVLLCHSSFRGVIGFFRDVLDQPIALGTVHNIVQQAVGEARRINARQDLSRVRAGSHDELFQGRQPVLVGIDLDSTYCYLLALEAHRDARDLGDSSVGRGRAGTAAGLRGGRRRAGVARRASAGLARGALRRGCLSRVADGDPPGRDAGKARLCGDRPARGAGAEDGRRPNTGARVVRCPNRWPGPVPRGHRRSLGRHGADVGPVAARGYPRLGRPRRPYPRGAL